jgi:hypothetical protein
VLHLLALFCFSPLFRSPICPSFFSPVCLSLYFSLLSPVSCLLSLCGSIGPLPDLIPGLGPTTTATTTTTTAPPTAVFSLALRNLRIVCSNCNPRCCPFLPFILYILLLCPLRMRRMPASKVNHCNSAASPAVSLVSVEIRLFPISDYIVICSRCLASGLVLSVPLSLLADACRPADQQLHGLSTPTPSILRRQFALLQPIHSRPRSRESLTTLLQLQVW